MTTDTPDTPPSKPRTNRERQAAHRARHRESINAKRRARRAAARAAKAPAKAPAKPSTKPLADRIADFASTLTVPHGEGQGGPFRLQPHQVDWLRMATADGIREAGLSMPRKLGKSSLVAIVVLYHLLNPPSPYWRALVCSLNAKLAGELRDLVEQIAEASGKASALRVVRSPPPGYIVGAQGARVDFLASDKARSGTGHGAAANLAIVDEGGLMPAGQRPVWAGMMTSVSSRNGRLWAIGVQGFSPMFRSLADRAGDPAVAFKRFAADPDCEIDDRSQWAKANPGLGPDGAAGTVKPMSYMADLCRRAVADADEEPTFRSLELNQDATPHKDVIVTLSEWKRCVASRLPPRTGHAVLGLDLGDTDSMSAITVLWPASGRMESWATMPGEPDIEARARRDNIDYRRMVDEGTLTIAHGRRTTPVVEFLGECAERLRGVRVALVAADRFRYGEVMDALDALRAPWPVHERLSWRGAGAGKVATGSRDIREFRNAVLGERIRERGTWLMESAIVESELVYDDLGNPKLKRYRGRGKIDALASAVIATGAAAEYRPPSATKWLKVA